MTQINHEMIWISMNGQLSRLRFATGCALGSRLVLVRVVVVNGGAGDG